jgi:uncharacterized membrane protein YdjX (TVP38/TMEM64 family)
MTAVVLENRAMATPSPRFTIALAAGPVVLVLAVLGIVLLALRTPGCSAEAGAATCMEVLAQAAGPAGPVLIVLALAGAVIFSPVPNGPIAVAAGMIYGTALGAALTLAGAVLGALAAFSIGRWLQYSPGANRHVPGVAWLARPRPPGALMAVVFLSRLVPFISFDAVSYAAGMTSLSLWRFTLATVAGAAPASLIFAAAGPTLLAQGAALAGAVLVGLTLVPALLGLLVPPLRQRYLRWRGR